MEIKGEGLVLVLDASEIIPHDPGAGTPAMVYSANKRHSATFWCALNEGELDCGDVRLTRVQMAWLVAQEDAVDRFIANHSR